MRGRVDYEGGMSKFGGYDGNYYLNCQNSEHFYEGRVTFTACKLDFDIHWLRGEWMKMHHCILSVILYLLSQTAGKMAVNRSEGALPCWGSHLVRKMAINQENLQGDERYYERRMRAGTLLWARVRRPPGRLTFQAHFRHEWGLARKVGRMRSGKGVDCSRHLLGLRHECI